MKPHHITFAAYLIRAGMISREGVMSHKLLAAVLTGQYAIGMKPHHVTFAACLIRDGMISREGVMDPQLLAAALSEGETPITGKGLLALQQLLERPRLIGFADGRVLRALIARGMIDSVDSKDIALLSEAAGRVLNHAPVPVTIYTITQAGRDYLSRSTDRS